MGRFLEGGSQNALKDRRVPQSKGVWTGQVQDPLDHAFHGRKQHPFEELGFPGKTSGHLVQSRMQYRATAGCRENGPKSHDLAPGKRERALPEAPCRRCRQGSQR